MDFIFQIIPIVNTNTSIRYFIRTVKCNVLNKSEITA